MSPWLFNMFMDKCVNGIKVGDADVRILLYAMLLAESAEKLQVMIGDG
jgi:hypothetical protein